MSIDGVDVSVYQAATPPLTGLGFLFARATYGTDLDSRYLMHLHNAQAAGLVTGAYHFGRDMSIADQVTAFLAVAKDADLLALDLEADGPHPSMTQTQAMAFIGGVHKAGRKIGLYHSESGYPIALGQDWNWVAKWGGTAPGTPWQFWQYQGSPLDRDRFAGSLADLRTLAGTGMTGGPMQGTGDTMIAAGGLTITSSHVLTTTAKIASILDAPGGSVVVTVTAGHAYPYLGNTGGFRAALVNIAKPYPDGQARPTVLYIDDGECAVTAAPAVPDPTPFSQADVDAAFAKGEAAGDVKHTVGFTVTIDGATDHIYSKAV